MTWVERFPPPEGDCPADPGLPPQDPEDTTAKAARYAKVCAFNKWVKAAYRYSVAKSLDTLLATPTPRGATETIAIITGKAYLDEDTQLANLLSPMYPGAH